MSDSNAIVARRLTKSYAVPDGRWLGHERIRGVTDVSFTLRRGGSLAIIGRNGAGKSTLLRMLAGLSRPSSGELRLHGRVGSLLDLGAGFVEEWTGEQNARAALALLGLDGARVRDAAELVAAFSELSDFLGRPVRIYSAGMRLRLAFSIAIATGPEILVSDEVLAVGDEAFQRKCSHHIVGHLAGGGTMVLATHNLYQAERLCGEAIWLDEGCVRLQGGCHEVTKRYVATLEEREAADEARRVELSRRGGSRLMTIEGHPRCDLPVTVPFGTVLRIGVDVRAEARVEIKRVDGTLVSAVAAHGRGMLEIGGPSLLPGRYAVRLLGANGDRAPLDELWIECVGERRELGTVHLEHQWI